MTDKLLEFGCDWITCTAPLEHENQKNMDAVFYAIAEKMHQDGHEMKNVRRLGYTGQNIGGMFIGSSKQGSMLQASGAAAGEVLQALKAVCTCIHITRIDTQVTIQQGDDNDTALHVFEQTERAKEKIPSARRWKACHIHTNCDGCTANVGSRHSEIYIRVYDKTREMKPTPYPENAWRYEVEAKQKLAQRIYDNWPKSEQSKEYCLAVVGTALANRGIDAPWHHGPLEIDLRITKPTTDEERKLIWLREYVRGTVQLLSFRGLQEEVLDALGLVMV